MMTGKSSHRLLLESGLSESEAFLCWDTGRYVQGWHENRNVAAHLRRRDQNMTQRSWVLSLCFGDGVMMMSCGGGGRVTYFLPPKGQWTRLNKECIPISVTFMAYQLFI